MNESAPGANQDPNEAPFEDRIDPQQLEDERAADRAGTETWYGESAHDQLPRLRGVEMDQAEAPVVDTRPQDPRRRLSDKTRQTGLARIRQIRAENTFEDPIKKAEIARREAIEQELRRHARSHRNDGSADQSA